jgi:dTDP-4-amino-4,6-dideoxygalactose transaminase
MQIPLLDLKVQYQSIREEVNKSIQNVLDNCNFIMGEDVKKLEEEIAAYCATKFAVGVASGTDALLLALMGLGVEEGDEIITTPFTFIATTEAISKLRAKIVFADIDPETYNIDVKKIEKKITPKTKVILPVHLYGQAADMGPIMQLAKEHNLKVLEDCAQAIGAEYHGKKVGSIGDVGCLSFFPSKNLGCYGDGGMVVTSNSEVAEKVRILRIHGCKVKYYHLLDGYNSRLDTLQAAVLRVKLKYIDTWNEMRRKNAAVYNKLFASLKNVITPTETQGYKDIFYAYTIRVKNREAVQKNLKEKNIASAIYYPIPLHLQDVYVNLGYKKGDFPVSEQFSDEVISIPMYPELTEEQMRFVVDCIGQVA